MANNNLINSRYILKLYIAGASPNSVRAVSNLKAICEEYLKDEYELEIIDIHQQPKLAKDAQVIAVPLLIKFSPLPIKRLIGNMSDKDNVIKGLGLNDINF